MRLFWIAAFVILPPSHGWKQCSEETGGGQCPDSATCCPTETPGVSSCITRKHDDPEDQGACCNDGSNTGCGYGFDCAVEEGEDGDVPYCKLREKHAEDMTHDIPRYQLCTVPPSMQDFHGFPIQAPTGTFQLAYYSSRGSITEKSTDHRGVEDVLIMVHGSTRNADDYFCSALAIASSASNNTLVIAPKFAVEADGPILDNNLLVWAEKRDEKHPLSHSWRYGADALNAPISSYQTLDLIVEYLVGSWAQFPNLRRISVAGHSAGAQVTHRWALLSNSPAWDQPIDIRAVVANPRSYCYLDARRFTRDGTDEGDFDIPDQDDTALCPRYDQWQWGLEPGGSVVCPYKDQAIADAPGLKERYATRRVIYLSGEYDTDAKPDQCETSLFQGKNRRERSEKYYKALEYYFGRKVHKRLVVPKSPHDHCLMLQSVQGQEAIFGPSGIDGLLLEGC